MCPDEIEALGDEPPGKVLLIQHHAMIRRVRARPAETGDENLSRSVATSEAAAKIRIEGERVRIKQEVWISDRRYDCFIIGVDDMCVMFNSQLGRNPHHRV